MHYVSTRGLPGDPTASFTDILLEGLAPDGGLYLPEHYPSISPATLAGWRTLLERDGYAALAHAVLGLFIDDIPSEDLREICERAYNDRVFSDPAIVPVTALSDGLYLAHLSNGPTAAFKDMA
ncbi:MAG: threonine synthase, partial [Propionicimonas sp.]|nr:threonine synthase [Propionicimonas sp.]